MKHKICLFVFSVILFISSAKAQSPSSSYRLSQKIHLEGDGGWDYLAADESNDRLYVSHGNVVQVMDTKTSKVIGTISDLKGVHGIAFANELNKGFISSGKDSNVVVFDLKTFVVLEKVKVTGRNPDAILYEPLSKRVFAFNGGSSSATVLDAKTNKILATIALEGKPEFAVHNGSGKIFVNIEDKSLIQELDPLTMKAVQHWPLEPGEEPSGLAIDVENHRLFSVCDNKLMVILDEKTGKVISSVSIGASTDGVAFDKQNKRIYSSNGEGTMTVVQEENPDTYKVLENVPTQKGARTITLNSKTHHVYIPSAEYGPKPEPTADKPKPRAPISPNSFVILDFEPLK